MSASFPNTDPPGTHVQESDPFPPSVEGVSTAVGAFVGYTEKAEIEGKSAFFTPVRIDSLADYETIFGKGFSTKYAILPVTADNEIENGSYDFTSLNPATSARSYYRLMLEPSSRFYLYNALRLFYNNGGGRAWIVSVGDYTGSGKTPEGEGVDEGKLKEGLNAIAEQIGPTMLVVPDAVALPGDSEEKPWISGAFQSVVRAMLGQSEMLGDRMAILDVYGTEYVGTKNMDEIIVSFQDAVGNASLSYGGAYFPFLKTQALSSSEISYANIAADSRELLKELLGEENAAINNNGSVPAEGEAGSANYEKVKGLIAEMWSGEENVAEVNESLVAASPMLQSIEQKILDRENILPPSGEVAGIWATNDRTRGVWNAPAGINLSIADTPTIALTDSMQEELNAPTNGKALNVIRAFPGYGSVLWGARTLDANSPDWGYIQVRRAVIYIEQSIKNALNPFVFAPNNARTWQTVVSLISSFLTDLWTQGGLMGASASDAYNVQCGLGSTMTAQDILDGYMVVQVTLQMVRPAEFIALTFRQKMEA